MNNKKCNKSRRKQILPKIDNKAPHFDASTYLKSFELQQHIMRVRKTDQENLDLLRKMNVIHRLGGKVDCWAPDIEYKSRFVHQDRRNKEIMRENRNMLKKIYKATSEYPARKSLEDWKNRRRLIEHVSRRTPFHRIVVGYWCQGGDVTKFNGTGGASIYGDSFDNENFKLRHAGPGVLSMCADNNGRNDSKFNLTFKRLETVDGHNVVFGRIIDGMVNVYKVITPYLSLVTNEKSS